MPALLASFAISAIVSFFCSLFEAVILSVTPAYIEVAVQKGQKHGKILQSLKKQIDRPLAAVLTVNTITNTLGAAAVGVETAHLYGDAFVAVTSALLTIVILIGSEIIPKTLGASNWKKLAPVCAYGIRLLIFISYPFVVLSERISLILSHAPRPHMTREEMIMTAELGATEGSIKKKESLVIRNLLMLDNIFVHDIMTPRSVVLAFDSTMRVDEVMKSYRPIRFSRIPIYTDDLDHIDGMVHRYKILEASSNDQDAILMKDLATPIHSVSETVSVAALLDQFIQRHDHIFVVTDEYGSITGIVTLEDAIETLLGVEIVDEFDSVADMRQFALDQWKRKKEAKQRATP